MMNVTKGKTNYNKEAWEKSDFPIVCATCLGDNPYVKMMRIEFDKECKTCSRPFTVFRWRPGKESRYKKTEICQTCSKLKNVCQTCLLDLEFGLPVQVRDTALQIESDPNAPVSEINREYQAEANERAIANGQSGFQPSQGRVEVRQALIKLARTAPYQKRNQAHVCSFFVKGDCKRGSECPFRHELPEENELANQNIRDRYHGTNDPVAKRLLNKLSSGKLNVPADKTITTLYIGNVRDPIKEEDIRDLFYSYGEIKDIKMAPQSMGAFVTFTKREDAEKAADSLYQNLQVKEISLRLSWGTKSQLLSANSPSITPVNIQATSIPSANTSNTNFFNLPSSALDPKQYTILPPNPSLAKSLYPSMDQQRTGGKRDR